MSHDLPAEASAIPSYYRNLKECSVIQTLCGWNAWRWHPPWAPSNETKTILWCFWNLASISRSITGCFDSHQMMIEHCQPSSTGCGLSGLDYCSLWNGWLQPETLNMSWSGSWRLDWSLTFSLKSIHQREEFFPAEMWVGLVALDPQGFSAMSSPPLRPIGKLLLSNSNRCQQPEEKRLSRSWNVYY